MKRMKQRSADTDVHGSRLHGFTEQDGAVPALTCAQIGVCRVIWYMLIFLQVLGGTEAFPPPDPCASCGERNGSLAVGLQRREAKPCEPGESALPAPEPASALGLLVVSVLTYQVDSYRCRF